MRPLFRAVAVILAALLCSFAVGDLRTTTVLKAPATSLERDHAPAYTYDNVHILSVTVDAVAERGPPASSAPNLSFAGDVFRSYGASARSGEAPGRSITADTSPGAHAQAEATTVTTGDHVAVIYGGFSSSSRSGVAAESAGGVRFVANSAGDVVPYVRSGTLEVTDHAALALSQRNVGIHALDDLVSSSEGFPYWHDGLWKTGYYDPATRLFAGTAEGRVTTVIQGSRVNANYINNLQAARP